MKKILGMLFLAGWVSGELLRWNGIIPITLMDMATALLLINALCRQTIVPRHRVFLWLGFIGMGSWLLGLRLFSIGQSLPGLLYLIRILGYLLVILYARELFKSVEKWIYLALITFVVSGLGQYIFLPDTRFLLQYGWDEHYYRLIGTVLDPNYIGAMLGMMLIFSANQFLKTKKWKWGILGVLGIWGLSLTFSRASWLATGIGSIFVLKKQRQLVKLGILGVLGIGGVYLLAPKPGGEGINLTRVSSIEQRLDSWQEGISVWKEHPWLGVGFNNYAVASERADHAANAPSSSWVLILATTGIIGMIGVTAIGIREIWGIEEIGEIWLAITVLIAVHAVFNNTLFYAPILGLIVLIRAASEE